MQLRNLNSLNNKSSNKTEFKLHNMVLAHADARNGNRRRARMFNQKQCKHFSVLLIVISYLFLVRRTRTIRQDQLVDLNSAQ